MAGLATHPSAEPNTLVVRQDYEAREWLLAEAPETYYLTDYYRPYPSCWCVWHTSTGTRCATYCPRHGG